MRVIFELFRPSSRAETDVGSESTYKLIETILPECKQLSHNTTCSTEHEIKFVITPFK